MPHATPHLLRPNPRWVSQDGLSPDHIRTASDGWMLSWADEFDSCPEGRTNNTMWQHERGYVHNRELQFYQEENARCVDGVLVITSRFDEQNLPHDTKPGAVTDPGYQMFHHKTLAPSITSASMVSRSQFGLGQFDSRIRFDTQGASWPAWWLTGVDGADGQEHWPERGEVDILEFHDGKLFFCLIYWVGQMKDRQDGKRVKASYEDCENGVLGRDDGRRHDKITTCREGSCDLVMDASWADRFHEYTFVWSEAALDFFLDGLHIKHVEMVELRKHAKPVNPWSAESAHHIRLNLAVPLSTDWNTAMWPIKMEVDYVRHFVPRPPSPPPAFAHAAPAHPKACTIVAGRTRSRAFCTALSQPRECSSAFFARPDSKVRLCEWVGGRCTGSDLVSCSSSASAPTQLSLDDDEVSQCMLHHEPRGAARVHAQMMEKSTMLCKARGWQGACQPPCTCATIFSSSEPGSACLDPRRPPHPRVHAESTRALLARAAEAAAGGRQDAALPFWRNKSVRVRGFVHDGFWVRAHFVMSQGLWASLRRMPFFVHLHERASCAHARAACTHERAQPISRCMDEGTCDAYSSAGNWHAGEHAPGWEEYFEPINGVPLRDVYQTTPEERIVELQCEAAWATNSGVMGGSFHQFVTYPHSFDAAVAYRERNAMLVRAWVRPRASIQAQADAEWARLFPDSGPVLGVHLRGTDKYVLPKVEPSRYFPLVDAYLAAHPSAQLYLATDDAKYGLAMARRYPARVRQLFDGKVLRAANATAIWRDHDASSAHRKGVEVILDTLLLAKCDFLLKSASSVSEFAIYFSPRLINESFDFSLLDQPMPAWATQSSDAPRATHALSGLRAALSGLRKAVF